MSLLEEVQSHVMDDTVSGLVMEVEHHPLNGNASPVAPPTYVPPDKKDRTPHHALTQEAFVPRQAVDGWYTELQLNSDGTPRLAPRVVLNSYAAQSGRSETATWNAQDRIGILLPAIIVDGHPLATESTDAQLAEALSRSFSTWELAHRQNDAWIKFATADGATLVWQQEVVPIGDDVDARHVKSLIATASAERGELLFRYFPNSAINGFWVSTGVATRHRLPRAYSSEIVGFGARPTPSGATKLDATGGALSSTGVVVKDDGSLEIKPTATEKTRPSKAGFGQVPANVETRSYTCELILEQSSLSLQVLRSLRYPNPDQAAKANVALVLLSLLGHALSAEDGFLRSGCALVPIAERWGWRRRGERSPETLEVASVDEIAAALREALSEAAEVGLRFAEPIVLSFSQPELEMIQQRVVSDANTLTSEE